MRRMISTAKLQQIEDGIENVTKIVPTSLNIESNELFLEHDSIKLTGQKSILLNASDFKVNTVNSKLTINVKHKQYFNHFVRIKLTGDGEFFFCINIIDEDNTQISSPADINNHLKGSSHNALVTGYLKMIDGAIFQPMYLGDQLKIHGYLNGVLTPIFLETTPNQYILGTIIDDVSTL